jgi:hypothetical protein
MKINLPDGWHEVTVSQFQEIAELSEDEYRDNTVISILANVDGIDNITVDSRLNCLNAISWAFTPPDEKTYKRQVTIKQTDFYLRNYRDLKIGERIDLREYSKNAIKNLHKICAILYKPEIEVKNGDVIFQDAMISDVYGSLVFFWNIANRSSETITYFLIQEMKALKEKQKKKDLKD